MNPFLRSSMIGEQPIIREIQDTDLEQLMSMHDCTSATSLYARYLRHHQPSREELLELCLLPNERGTCLVALADRPGQPILGVAHYIVQSQNPHFAEPAILVADSVQQRGIGRMLFTRLAQLAAADGVQHFTSVIYSNNRAIFALLRSCRLHYTSEFAYGCFEVDITL